MDEESCPVRRTALRGSRLQSGGTPARGEAHAARGRYGWIIGSGFRPSSRTARQSFEVTT
jgi:hypothetical protein